MTDELWTEARISATLEELGLSAGADANLADPVRFVRRVRECLSAFTNRHGGLAESALFLLAPSIPDSVKDRATLRRRIHTGEVNPSGNVWIVGAAVADGHAVPFQGASTEQIFDLACTDLGLGGVPAVFCDAMVSPQLFAWYPSGLSQAERLFEGPIALTSPPTLADLIEIVDRVHQTRLMTTHHQSADTALWQNHAKYWAHERAEKRVQDALMAGLGGAFGKPYFVDQEAASDSGRFDIGFREATAPGQTTLHAILELKLARSFGSTGIPKSPSDNEQHAVDGVEQAWAYAADHGTKGAACLVFDLRTEDQHQHPTRASARAEELSVLLRLWRCFPSAEHYRDFRLAGNTGQAS